MSAVQKLLDLVNQNNPGANLVQNDVAITPAADNTNPAINRDTAVTLYQGPSRRLRGSIPIWYNRIDLSVLFKNIAASVNYEMPSDTGIVYTTHHILETFNNRYGLDLELSDITAQPLTVVNGVGRATIMAAPGNLVWKGFVEITFGTSIPTLSQLILNPTLSSFNLLSEDPSKGSAAIYSYNLDGTNDPDLYWQQLLEGPVTEAMVDHFNLLQGLGSTWVYSLTPAPYNLYGATVEYSGDNAPESIPSNITQAINPVFDNVAVITLSDAYCVNFAGRLTVYSNDVVIVEPTPDWHSDHYAISGVIGSSAWLSQTELFVDSNLRITPESWLVAGRRPVEVLFNLSNFGIDNGQEGAGSWVLRITAHSADDTIIGSVDVSGDGEAALEIDNHDVDIAYFQFNDQVAGGCHVTVLGVSLSGVYIPPIEEPEEPEEPLPDLGAFVFRMVPTNDGFLDSDKRLGDADPDYTVTMDDIQGSTITVQLGSTMTLAGGMPTQRQIFRDYTNVTIGNVVGVEATIGNWDTHSSLAGENGPYKPGGRAGRPAVYYYDHTDMKISRCDAIIDAGFDEVFFGGAFRTPTGKAFPGGNIHWPNSTPVTETFINRSAWKVLWCDVYDGGGNGDSDFIVPSYAQLDQMSMFGGNSHSVVNRAVCAPTTFWHFGDKWNCGRFWIKNNRDLPDTGIIHQEWFTPKATVRSEGQGRILDDRDDASMFTQFALCKWIEGNDICQMVGGEDYIAIGENAPCRVEVGDHPDFYKCRDLAICPPLSWETGLKEVTAYRNKGDFTAGKPQFVFVIGPNNLPISRYGRLWNTEAV